MTPKEALEILDQVAAAVTTNREGHQKIQMAITVLREATTPKPEKKS